MAYDNRRTSAARRPLPPPPPYWTQGPKPDWLLLPRDVLATIFFKLGAVEIIESVQNVCTLWRSISMDPSLWKRIHIRSGGHRDDTGYNSDDTGYNSNYMLCETCCDAVDRSRGGCVDISIEYFGDEDLLRYIVKSCQLRRLRLFRCSGVSNKGLSMVAANLPLLETFENYYNFLSEKALVVIGKNCPHLTTLKFIKGRYPCRRKDKDKEAFAIAKYMPGLRHLTLLGNKLTNTGLEAILDGCPHLESLDLRQCYNVDLRGDIAKRCWLIKDLKHPMDPFDGYGSDSSIDDNYKDYYTDSSNDWPDYTFHSSPSPPPRHWTRGRKPNSWLALPRRVFTKILLKLGAIEIIESAQKVCTLWRAVCKDPSMWTHIDMRNFGCLGEMPYSLEKMCRHAIDRSLCGCIDINVEYFGDEELLSYIIDSGCRLRRLRLILCWSISNDEIAEAAPGLSSLETFEYYMGNISEEGLIALGKNCPRLTSLRFERESNKQFEWDTDGEAFAIAKFMPGLRHLSLLGNRLTNTGLAAILDCCHHLESLDLRRCLNIDLKGDLARKCEQIKVLKRPWDSTAGYEFSASYEESCLKHRSLGYY